MAQDKLYDQLSAKHPDYEAWEGEWERYRDVLGDDLVEKEHYLPQNKFEPVSQYEFRVKVSQFIPESGIAIDRLLGALYEDQPKRDMKGHEADLRPFLEAADTHGKSWSAVVEEIAFNLLGYGATRVLVNVRMPSDIPEGGLTRAEEQQRTDLKPQIINYTPASIIDWETDESGRLTYCRIREERTVRVDDLSSDKRHLKEVKFIAYDREKTTWWVFRESESSSEMEQVGTEQTSTDITEESIAPHNIPARIQRNAGSSPIVRGICCITHAVVLEQIPS